MMHQECCNWKDRLMCVVGILWGNLRQDAAAVLARRDELQEEDPPIEALRVWVSMRELRWAWWWFEGCLEWRGDCWKLESSQVGLWPTCWHAKPAEGMIVGMILPQSTLIRFISHRFLWHCLPTLWCDRRWQKQPSPNEPWLLRISRLASTKEVDLKSKVQQEFYRNERKRQGHSGMPHPPLARASNWELCTW